MQIELDALGTVLNIQILGLNGVGYESANDLNCQGKDIPWLQDQASENVWALWAVTYRDVVVLDENNEVLFIYNLTTYDLGNPANYQALRDMLADAAGP